MMMHMEEASPWLKLTPELLRYVASLLPHNEVTDAMKLANSEAAAALRQDYSTYELCRKPECHLPSACTICAEVMNIPEPLLAEHPSWPGTAFVAHWGRPEPWRVLNRRQRHRLVCLAASSLHPPSLDAVLAHCGVLPRADALASAAAVGDLPTWCAAPWACNRLLHTACAASHSCMPCHAVPSPPRRVGTSLHI